MFITEEEKQKYLFLPNLNSKESYVISMCPMNSSGDGYHILAYAILAKSHEKEIPPIQLTYDSDDDEQTSESKMNNYTAVCRTITLAKVISCTNLFLDPLYLNPGVNAETGEPYKRKTYQQNVRQHNLTHTLKHQYTHFIDQKLLTTLIAQYFLQYGRTDTINKLKKGFSVFNDGNQHLKTVVKTVNTEYQKIITTIGTKPLVIIHARYASTANDVQNIEDDALNLKNYLVQNGYFVWFIMADGRSKGTSFKQLKNENRTDPFPHYLEGDHTDYGKFYHLRLLLKLTEFQNVKIIGNTSGTLDLAAFLGHNVYNLHIWNKSMNYQCARIIIQSTFLTLDLITADFLSQLEPTDEDWKLSSWLMGQKQKIKTDTDTVQSAFTAPTQAGYRDLFCIQTLNEEKLVQIEYFEKIKSFLLELHKDD
ncbi:MAG: hypothetical protein KBD31_00180 [Proteobacteria bacterium]|nr:hypothetical protein [Pseudomonadota bacterium]